MMETETVVVPSSRNMLRPDDIRVPRSATFEEADRPPRASSEDTRMTAGTQDLSAMLQDSPPRKGGDEETSTPTVKADATLLSLDDTAELFKQKVAKAQQDTNQAFESEGVAHVMKPKLTLDLGHSNIARLPETVVDLIKDEVDRLSLSHNQIWHIPLRFSECVHLRYLNIRSNVFREIPRGVYKLPLLEILDVSRNKVRKIPSDIRNLTSLRVFSIVHNKIEDLPTELCEMNKLSILKIAENPLRFKLKKVVEAKEAEVSFSEMTDTERETVITVEIKRFLRESHPIVAPIDVEAAQQLEENPMETPKPAKRMPSSRFPVIPSTANSDVVGESTRTSPNQPGGPPPIPTRSHYRMTSGQGMATKRPGITPLLTQSDRMRSHSESLLQNGPPSARTKRMAMIRNKTELDSIEETKSNRNSHFRGFSHASVLKKGGVLASPGMSGSSSSPNSPRETRSRRYGFVRRLSSLPEAKGDGDVSNPVIQGAKGILYALYQIHPQISGLIAAIKGIETKRSSLELTFYNASTHVDRLNEALEEADSLSQEDSEAIEKVEETVTRDCGTCISAYLHVSSKLQDSVKKIVARSDPRYVRTLMLLLYGTIIEIRNAISTFGFEVKVDPGHRRQTSSGHKHPIQTIPEEFATPHASARLTTPSRDGVVHQRPGPRIRSDTTIKHPTVEIPSHPLPSQINSAQPTPISLTGSTVAGSTFASTASTYTNGTMSSASSYGVRSRSNSRNASNSSNASFSSATSTPRSDAFHLPRSTSYFARINPATGMTESQEEALFGQVFLALTRAYEAALQAIPLAKDHFIRCLHAARENRQPKSVQDLWSTLIYRCNQCFDVSEALQLRLTTMRIKDADGGRNDPSFWHLCKMFLQSFVELVTEMKEVRSLRLLPQELILILRPVQKTSREAGRLIESSPWRSMTDGVSTMPAPTPYSSASSVPPLPVRNDSYSYLNGHTNGINGHGPSASKDSFATYSSALSQQQQQMMQNLSPDMSSAPAVQPFILPSANSVTMSQASISASAIPPQMLHIASPLTSPLPATPLSAALGPAAQATVPTSAPPTAVPTSNIPMVAAMSNVVPNTPSTASIISPGATEREAMNGTQKSGYGDSMFRGDVFQRADTLLSMSMGNMSVGNLGMGMNWSVRR